MKIVFAAGGTGGHINPALAIADKVKEVFPACDILFIGSPNGLEAKLVTNAGYSFTGVKMSGLKRKLTPSAIAHNIGATVNYVTAEVKVKKILKDYKPDLVIGTGGYVTGTVLKAALKCGIKTAVHESNSLPGVSVKVLAPKMDLVMLGSEDAKKHLKECKRCVVTGNPLRNNIPIESRSDARKRLGLPDCFTVLSAGGSQGAARINEAVAHLLSWEQKKGDINHIHAYGKFGRDTFPQSLEENGVNKDDPHFIIKEYIDNMYTCMCASDLIITRAGAMTLTELTAIGRASILVPYPYAAENHQYYNALTLKNVNAGRIINDKDLDAQTLIDMVNELYDNYELITVMEENAARMSIKDSAGVILKEIIDLLEIEG